MSITAVSSPAQRLTALPSDVQGVVPMEVEVLPLSGKEVMATNMASESAKRSCPASPLPSSKRARSMSHAVTPGIPQEEMDIISTLGLTFKKGPFKRPFKPAKATFKAPSQQKLTPSGPAPAAPKPAPPPPAVERALPLVPAYTFGAPVAAPANVLPDKDSVRPVKNGITGLSKNDCVELGAVHFVETIKPLGKAECTTVSQALGQLVSPIHLNF